MLSGVVCDAAGACAFVRAPTTAWSSTRPPGGWDRTGSACFGLGLA